MIEMEKLTKANEILREFPRQIFGARDIIMHEIPGAKYCAVHVGAMHSQPVHIAEICARRCYGEDASEQQVRDYVNKSFKMANAAQRDVYRVLNYLYDNYGVREIIAEGVAREPPIEKIQEEYDKFLGELPSRGYFKKEFEEGNLEAFRYLVGGDILMGIEKGMKILPGEDLKIREVWQKDFMDGKNDLSIIEDAREDYMIRSIAGSKNVLSAFTFGMGHKFMGRINHWNKYNPNSKLSLIEIFGKGPSELEKLV